MTKFKQPDEAQHNVDCTIDELNEITSEVDAEKSVAHAKGYISALRHNQLIEHEHFKPMDEALDKALCNWHLKHEKL